MELNNSAVRELTDVVGNALKGYRIQSETVLVTDIHLQPLRESAELVVRDDDRELGRARVGELAEIPEQEFYSVMENTLRTVLGKIDAVSPLDKLNIWKPFSIVMTDEEGDTAAELMLFDDDTQLVSQTLMADLDEDLEQFLKELLSN